MSNFKRPLPEEFVENKLFKKHKMKTEKIKKKRSIKIKRKSTEKISRFFDDCDVSLLPTNYRNLLELFICLDTSVNILISKGESLFLSNLNEIIFDRLKKEFTKNELGRILRIFPESYKYELINDQTELKIAPNLKFGDEKNTSPRKTIQSLSLNQLLERKTYFYNQLYELVNQTHSNFITKKSIKRTRSIKIRRWHAEFEIETECPKIEPIEFDKEEKLCFISPFVKEFQKVLDISADKIIEDLFNTDKTVNQTISNEDNKCYTLKNKSAEINKENEINVKAISKIDCEREDLFIRVQKLPFHMKIIYERFKNVEIAMNNCNQILFNDLVKKMTKISMEDIGRILQVYPESYKVRWQCKKTNTVTKLDLLIEPNLKNDCSESSATSPRKNQFKFDNKRRIDRCHIFLDKCMEYVDKSYKKYLESLNLNSEQIETQMSLLPIRHSDFNINMHVPIVEPSEFPEKPTMMKDQKISAFLPTRKVTMTQLLEEDKLKTKPEFEGLSVLEKIRLRNAKCNILTKKQCDERVLIKDTINLTDTIFFCLKNNKRMPKLQFLKLLSENCRKSTDEVEKMLDLLEKVSPGWLFCTQSIFSLEPICDSTNEASISLKDVKQKLNDYSLSIVKQTDNMKTESHVTQVIVK